MRNFSTGATRDSDETKLDYEGFLSPLVLERFAVYMHSHRVQADGSLRDSDNWQKGIPKEAYMKSAFRHFMDFWKEHRGIKTEYGLEESLAALMFNVMGYMHEHLKEQNSIYDKEAPWSPAPPSVAELLNETADPTDEFVKDYNDHYDQVQFNINGDRVTSTLSFPTNRRTYIAELVGLRIETPGKVVGQWWYPEEYSHAIKNAEKEWANAHPSLSRSPRVERGEVLGLSSKRLAGKVAEVAPEVCDTCGSEACACAGGCKWESGR